MRLRPWMLGRPSWASSDDSRARRLRQKPIVERNASSRPAADAMMAPMPLRPQPLIAVSDVEVSSRLLAASAGLREWSRRSGVRAAHVRPGAGVAAAPRQHRRSSREDRRSGAALRQRGPVCRSRSMPSRRPWRKLASWARRPCTSRTSIPTRGSGSAGCAIPMATRWCWRVPRATFKEQPAVYDPGRGYPRVVPYVLYADPAAAVRWLCEVLGLREALRVAIPR